MNEVKDDTLLVKQLVELTKGIPSEYRNQYEIYDIEGKYHYFAYELGDKDIWSIFLRSVLSSHRPFTLKVVDKNKNEIITVKRNFKFYYHEVRVYQGSEYIGCVERKFSFLNKAYAVFNGGGDFVCDIKGPLLNPWTFNIIQNNSVYGKIKKAWGGFLKESLTDADNFGVQFPNGSSTEVKKLLLAVVFLLDFVYFEDNKGSNNFPRV